MKKPFYFGEKEVAAVAASAAATFINSGGKQKIELSSVFKNDENIDVPFTMYVKDSAAFYSNEQAYSIWLKLNLPHMSVKELLEQGNFSKIRDVLLILSNVENAKSHLYKIYESISQTTRY